MATYEDAFDALGDPARRAFFELLADFWDQALAAFAEAVEMESTEENET